MNLQTHRWAVARMVLGILQMFGAVFGATLILQSGLNSLSLGIALGTGILTLLSISLFGGIFSDKHTRRRKA